MTAACKFLSGQKRRRLADRFRILAARKRNVTIASPIELRNQNQRAFVGRRGNVRRTAVKLHAQSLPVTWRQVGEFDRNFAAGNSGGRNNLIYVGAAAHLI